MPLQDKRTPDQLTKTRLQPTRQQYFAHSITAGHFQCTITDPISDDFGFAGRRANDPLIPGRPRRRKAAD